MEPNYSSLAKEDDYNSFYLKIDNLNRKQLQVLQAELTLLLEKNPNDLDLFVKRSIVIRDGDWNFKLSRKDSKHVLSQNPVGVTKIQSLLNLGLNYVGDRKFEKAVKIFDELRKLDNGMYYYAMARLYEEKEENENSLNAAEKGIEYFDSDSAMYFLILTHLGDSYSELGNVDKAIECYKKCGELFPKQVVPRLDLVKLYEKKGENEKSLRILHTIKKICPKYEFTNLLLGNIHQKKKDFGAAFKYYTEEIELNPGFRRTYVKRAVTNYHLKKYREAISDLTKAIEMGIDPGELLVDRGICYEKIGLLEESDNDFTESLKIPPSKNEQNIGIQVIDNFDFSLYFFRKQGEFSFKRGNFGRALYFFEKFRKFLEMLKKFDEKSILDRFRKDREDVVSSYNEVALDVKERVCDIFKKENIGEILRIKSWYKSKRNSYEDIEERVGYISENFELKKFLKIEKENCVIFCVIPSFLIDFNLIKK